VFVFSLPEPFLVCLQTSELVSNCEWLGSLVLFLVNHSRSISGEVFQDAGTNVVLGFVSAKQKGYSVTITRQTLMRAQQPNSSSSQNPTFMRLQGKEDLNALESPGMVVDSGQPPSWVLVTEGNISSRTAESPEDQVQASSFSGALETVPEEVRGNFFQFSSISYLVVAEYCKMCAFHA